MKDMSAAAGFTSPARFCYVSTMKAAVQIGFSGRVPAPPEERFPIYRLWKMIRIVLLAVALSPALATEVLVEAEAFDHLGGWVADSQFMDEMGSPFLLAHGLGKPVGDASTTVSFRTTGSYKVWVRTRDWVAPWKTADTAPAKRAEGTPGIFKVAVDGKPLPPTFGQKSTEWYWEPAGVVDITKRTVEIRLHDLTGFEGRCDAVLFSTDHTLVPPNAGKAMAQFRRKLLGLPEVAPDAGSYDLVVTGGGIAGVSAAVAGARSGLKVALVQDRPVLGGNNSSEVRVWLQGANKGARYPNLGLVVRELEQRRKAHYGPSNTAELYEDEKKIAIVRAQKNLSLFLNSRVNEVETVGGSIQAVIAQNTATARRLRFPGRWFADCTGDGCVGFLAGADFDITLKGHMGRCNLWNMKDAGRPVSFPRCPWALDLSDKPFPGRSGVGGIGKLGGWYWESGCFCDPFKQGEYIRDWNFRAMYGAVDCLKNVNKIYPNHELNWCAHISGKRESRRLLGDLILSKAHLFDRPTHPPAFTYETDIPSAKIHSDTPRPSLLADGRYRSAGTESVQYDGDVTITADLGKAASVTGIKVMAYQRQDDFAVKDVTVDVSTDKLHWRSRMRSGNLKLGKGDFESKPLELGVTMNERARYVRVKLTRAPGTERLLLGELVIEHKPEPGETRSNGGIDDGCVVTGWSIDLHLPDPKYEKGFEGDAFITRAHYAHYPSPFYIPYRCFYSRNIDNLFMAGRNISVTHEALGTVRVMRTGGLMGEVVGIAAGVCKDKRTTPRGVYEEHLDELKERLKRGVPRRL
jgi:hypothetical protein